MIEVYILIRLYSPHSAAVTPQVCIAIVLGSLTVGFISVGLLAAAWMFGRAVYKENSVEPVTAEILQEPPAANN